MINTFAIFIHNNNVFFFPGYLEQIPDMIMENYEEVVPEDLNNLNWFTNATDWIKQIEEYGQVKYFKEKTTTQND